jgi:hypothetical protein
LPIIGFVNVASAKGYAPQLSAFLKGLIGGDHEPACPQLD